MGSADVLRSLAVAVLDGTVLAFAITHAPGGGDPVAAAWAECWDDKVMRLVLMRACHPAWMGQAPGRLWCTGPCTRPGAEPCPHLDACAACCHAIRAAVPTLTLADVVGASAATRARAGADSGGGRGR